MECGRQNRTAFGKLLWGWSGFGEARPGSSTIAAAIPGGARSNNREAAYVIIGCADRCFQLVVSMYCMASIGQTNISPSSTPIKGMDGGRTGLP